MSIGDYIACGIIVVIITLAIVYIVKQKKKGVKCIGCPAVCKTCGDSKNNLMCCCNCNAQQPVEDNIQ